MGSETVKPPGCTCVSDIPGMTHESGCLWVRILEDRTELDAALEKCARLERERDEWCERVQVAESRAGIVGARCESLEAALLKGCQIVDVCQDGAGEWAAAEEFLAEARALLSPTSPAPHGFTITVDKRTGQRLYHPKPPEKIAGEGLPVGWTDTGDGGACKDRCGEATRFVFVRDGEVEITDGENCASAPVNVVAYQIRRASEPPEGSPGESEGNPKCSEHGDVLSCPSCASLGKSEPETYTCTTCGEASYLCVCVGGPTRSAIASEPPEATETPGPREDDTLERVRTLDQFNNEAFDAWFDLVHDCRKTGDMTQVDAMLRACSLLPQTFTTDMLLAFLRLVYNIRQHLPNWNNALPSVRTELVRRGKENVDALLHGLESEA